jgi:glycine/D-amino acid oxidase-like deaminating enzyme
MLLNKDFNHSYWELKTYFKNYDLIVIGAGIVGLSSAISFKEKNPKAQVLILERGILPDGASTKNAGFACFGSSGEILDDLKKTPEKTVWETVDMRWQGLQLLRTRLKDKNIAYEALGGYELFTNKKKLDASIEKLKYLNSQFKHLSGLKNCYSEVSIQSLKHFGKVKGAVFNVFEGQLDTGLLMKNLHLLATNKEITILNTIEVEHLDETNTGVELNTNYGVFSGKKVIVATNGFAASLLKIKDVKPARAQVLITAPISKLQIKGTYHFEEGYYYFRNIDNRILFGGGRNMDFKNENTQTQGMNRTIQDQLEKLLQEMILPGIKYTIEHRWSGIMGIGKEKSPIIRFHKKNTLIAVRMGGMGVAIGTWVGNTAARMIA